MATSSLIGVLTGENNGYTVYCHNDGYLSEVGQTLFDCYQEHGSIIDLMQNGDMSILGHDTNNCVFYHRDVGERLDLNMRKTFDDMEKIVAEQDYTYLFDMSTNEWIVRTPGSENWTTLEEELELI